MTTVLIAAHNEETVIGQTLDALLAGDSTEPLQIIVAANGCTDGTVPIAGRRPVEVVEVAAPGKATALNAAELRATGYPRVYLDADIQLDKDAIEQLAGSLRSVSEKSGRNVLAAVPARVVDTSASSRWVRMYYRVHAFHPAYASGLFGRGVVVLSEVGRERFAEFPQVIADDLFLDSLFDESETAHVDEVVSIVIAVPSMRALLCRLARVRRGNTELRAADSAGRVRRSAGIGWLFATMKTHPSLAPAAAVYIGVTLFAEARSRWGRAGWGAERSSGGDASSTRVTP